MDGLKRKVFLINKQTQVDFFRGMILPDVWENIADPTVFVFGALEGAEIIGAAVMRLENERAHLLSIAVKESRRRQGVGTALLRACVRALRRTSIQNFYTILMEEDTEAAALVSSFGMESSDEGSAYYSILLRDVMQLQILQNDGNKTLALKDVPDYKLNKYLQDSFPGNPALAESALFEPDLSRFLIEDGKITACMLMEKEEDALSVAWLASSSANKMAVLYLFKGALAAAIKKYPEDMEIRFTVFDEPLIRLVEHLLPKVREKELIKRWVLEHYAFRLTDTSAIGWEKN